MADSDSKGSALPVPQIVAVLAAIVAMFMPKSSPLASSRPPAKGTVKMESAPAELRFISARLWQDPLQAVEQYRSAQRADKKTDELITREAEENKESADRIKGIRDYIRKPAQKPLKEGAAPAQKTLVLVGCLPSVTNAENVERRLRARWAVLAALGRSGYVPREQIGYFVLHYQVGAGGMPPLPGEPREDKPKARIPIPYELIEPQFGKPEWCSDPSVKNVVLVWLPDDWIGTRPLDLLGQLGETLGWGVGTDGSPKLPVTVRVIGPSSSTVLTGLADEVTYAQHDLHARLTALSDLFRDLNPPVGMGELCRLRSFISPWANDILRFQLRAASDSMLRKYLYGGAFEDMEMLAATPTIPNALLRVFLERNPQATAAAGLTFHEGLERLGIKFNRTIAADDIVAGEMINELGLRGIHVCRRPGEREVDFNGEDIAVIAEWDTPYGRCLPLTISLAAMAVNEHPDEVGRMQEIPENAYFHHTFHHLVTMVDKSPVKSFPQDEQTLFPKLPRNIHEFYYFKGIDGNVPSQDAASKEKDREGAKPQDFMPTNKVVEERASGENQTDYLRRLAAHLLEGDRELRGEGRHIRAVLVLGSDLYDKFLVMKAIHSVMPDALLMTNNLDADMNSVDDLGGSQNLVVVSPYGLSLSEYYQHGVPPFRDSYQTSTYACALAATRFLNPELYPDPWKSDKPNFWMPQLQDEHFTAQDIAARRPRVYENGRHGFYDLSRDFGDPLQGFAGLKHVGTQDPHSTLSTLDREKLLEVRLHPLRKGPDGWLGRLQQSEHRWVAWWVGWSLFFAAMIMLTIHLVKPMYPRKKSTNENLALPRPQPPPPPAPPQPQMVENGGVAPAPAEVVAVPAAAAPAAGEQAPNMQPTFLGNLGQFVERRSVAVVLVLLSVMVVPVILFWLQAVMGPMGVEEGEPLSWTEGVSLWPTQGLRLAGLVVLIHMLSRTYASHIRTENTITTFLVPAKANLAATTSWNPWQILLLLTALVPAAAICANWNVSLHARTHVLKLLFAFVILFAAIRLHPKIVGHPSALRRVMSPLLWVVVGVMVVALLVQAWFFSHQVFTPPIFSGVVVLASILSYGVYYGDIEGSLCPKLSRKLESYKPVIKPEEKWGEYLLFGCFPVRAPRILLLTNMLFWLAALLLECWPAFPRPARGPFALLCESTSFTACTLALSFISAVVVDAVLLNRLFTYALRMSRSDWSNQESKVPKFLNHTALGNGLNEYMDMRLLSYRSRPVANLIYCPFIVLGFVVASQHHLVDSYPLHPPIVIIWVVNLALGCFCAWLLQRETNAARTEALTYLGYERAVVADDLEDSQREKKLGIFDRVMDEVRTMSDGAFAPLWDQPFVRAIFFSSGSIGLSSILSALSGWWK